MNWKKDPAEKYRIRIYGIDAPELDQQCGESAAFLLQGLLKSSLVILCAFVDTDRYGRYVCKVTAVKRSPCDPPGESHAHDVGDIMLGWGVAWQYTKYDNSELYSATEAIARRFKLGLWMHENPVPPWEFRKQKRENASGSK